MSVGLACSKEAHAVCGGHGCSCPCHERKRTERVPPCGDAAADHVDQAWRRIGPCVYCACGARLYQGLAPTTREEREAMAAFLDTVLSRGPER